MYLYVLVRISMYFFVSACIVRIVRIIMYLYVSVCIFTYWHVFVRICMYCTYRTYHHVSVRICTYLFVLLYIYICVCATYPKSGSFRSRKFPEREQKTPFVGESILRAHGRCQRGGGGKGRCGGREGGLGLRAGTRKKVGSETSNSAYDAWAWFKEAART